jgi:hypothetical protein
MNDDLVNSYLAMALIQEFNLAKYKTISTELYIASSYFMTKVCVPLDVR